MSTNKTTNSAFTLLEMMISVALGSLVMLTAMVGLRTASQTVTAANRLSLENSLMRAGYFDTQMQFDFWNNLDDPNKPDSDRKLKGYGSLPSANIENKTRGMPFVPMKDIYPLATKVPMRSMERNSGTGYEIAGRDLKSITGKLPINVITAVDDWEKDVGWDPTYLWAPHDPRTWCRVNLAEKDRHRTDKLFEKPDNSFRPIDPVNSLPPHLFGRYAIFSCASTDSNLTSYKIKRNINADPRLVNYDNSPRPDYVAPPDSKLVTPFDVTYRGYPTNVVHNWYPRQIEALLSCIGYAGFCEYLPPNTLYGYYKTSGAKNEGGLANMAVVPWDQNRWDFCNFDGNQRTVRGIYRQTYATSWGYLNPESPNDWGQKEEGVIDTPPNSQKLLEWYYTKYSSDYQAWKDDPDQSKFDIRDGLQWYYRHVNFPQKMMAEIPGHWPVTETGLGRYVKNSRHVAIARIRQTNSYTGEVIELSWTGLGTTLRGARMQRKTTSGWAKWDNASGASNDPHLDTP
jgi:prepilin-type N-terminal cleavage/methylation domain-containing protein